MAKNLTTTSHQTQQALTKFPAGTIDEGVLWGKQTQLSLKNFNIGSQCFNPAFIAALVTIKREAAQINHQLTKLAKPHAQAITFACDEILQGKHAKQFPLRIWQTGSGTQTNMNVNEVIATLANQFLAQDKNTPDNAIHPNDHVNMSQSSNDIFPSAMHIVVAQQTHQQLLPAITLLTERLSNKAAEFDGIFTVGRTHLMDALPVNVSTTFLAYQQQLMTAKQAIEHSMANVYQLALGGTAVGSGANAPESFAEQVIERLATHYQLPLVQHQNLYAAVSGEDALLRYSSALKQLAATLLKIANDVRLLGSGPRCGLNEWLLPANEPGSSIMPGKVNPTQCEALSMVCLQVFGNDLTVSMSAASGQLQLNTYRPVIIHNVLESIQLLSDAMNSFADNCVDGLTLNHKQIESNMRNNLSAITLLAPKLGYDKAAKIVHWAVAHNVSLAEASQSLNLLSKTELENLLNEQMQAQKTAQKRS
ncbi:fumarate hydratase class II [Thalassotalea insulae]|uniref:fumarate hydratase n=1 Tax=Thalassotalea insulae TaxID=2056778 RepID=A0ABQ6GS35_9GAMM|nr:class II fumarate hydratase [Thalassotalea insulae]GLX78765.1 fumarate hydratase class II [Thalassotalea insulae]